MTIPEGRRAFLESIFSELARETSEEREGSLIVQKSLVTLILADVIAERVGYADATHFIRIFRREHGVTPSVWRARHRRSDASNTPG